MNATKILWGQVLLVCAVVILFLWTATEWTAWQLAFQPRLGQPWFTLFGWPMYQPPAFFWWWFAYDAYAHEIFVTGGFIAGAGAGGRAAVRRAVGTFGNWNDPPPGFVEVDFVVHSGPSVSGSFVQTLVLTDIATGWTECVPVVVRSSELVIEALVAAHRLFPFSGQRSRRFTARVSRSGAREVPVDPPGQAQGVGPGRGIRRGPSGASSGRRFSTVSQ
jgi:hypothetical protein